MAKGRVVPGLASRVTRTVAGVLVLLSCATAQAQLALSWEAPAECPSGDAVRDEVRRLLGGTIPAPLDLRARGVASRREPGWTLNLWTTMDGVEGERRLDGDACEELGAAAALILALMIDPEAATDAAAEPEPPPEPPTRPPLARSLARDLDAPRPSDPSPRAISSGAPPAETREPEPRQELRALLGIGGLLDAGSVPDVSGGVSLEAGFGVPLVEARLRATLVFPRRAARDGTSGADITVGSMEARVCVHPFEGARLVHGCLGMLLGVAVAEGGGFDRSETGVGTYAAGLGGLGLAWRPEAWFDLELDATLIVPFNPLQFAVRASPDVVFHEMSPVAGRFGVATHARF